MERFALVEPTVIILCSKDLRWQYNVGGLRQLLYSGRIAVDNFIGNLKLLCIVRATLGFNRQS